MIYFPFLTPFIQNIGIYGVLYIFVAFLLIIGGVVHMWRGK